MKESRSEIEETRAEAVIALRRDFTSKLVVPVSLEENGWIREQFWRQTPEFAGELGA